jgi:hypothetical protein
MNYLSHYYFDQQNTDPYYILGIALPDLVKNSNRRWNVHPHKHEAKFEENPIFSSIYAGWKRHVTVDHYFHEAAYFLEKSHMITERMRTIPFENNKVKPFMIGHVGLEIMLDTLLLINHKINGISFYESLDKCDINQIIKFLELNEIENAADFEKFYARFCESRYLLSYQSNESIVYALNRIQYRLTRQFFTETDVRLMHINIAELMDIVEQDYLFIFDEIEAHLFNEKTSPILPTS